MFTRRDTDVRPLPWIGRLLLGGALGCGGCSWDQLNPFAAPTPAEAAAADSVVLDGSRVKSAAAPTEASRDLTAARDLFRQKEYDKAEKILHRLAEDGVDKTDVWDEVFRLGKKKTEVNSAVAEEARFYEAECLYESDNWPRAADTYKRLLNDFPTGTHREQACERLFTIANEWLRPTREKMQAAREVQEGQRWFVVPTVFHLDKRTPLVDPEGRALEALEAVRYNDISGPYADKALFLLGSVHFFNENYREADFHFTSLVESHANSEYAARATELAIISKHMCTGGSDYDGRKVAEARDLVHRAQASYPELTRSEEKREFLERQLIGITLQQAEKDFKAAEFYRRTNKPQPAYFMYEVVRRRYPGTKYAEMATGRMNELKDRVEAENRKAPPSPKVPEAERAAPRPLPDLGQK